MIDRHNLWLFLFRAKDLLLDFFKNLEASGVTDNTAIIIGGDHGTRRDFKYFETKAGSYESRLPLMYGIFPKWFREKYKAAYENLQFNGANRMTSQFDLYRTMRGILDKNFENPDSYYNPKKHFGVNLLAKIPEERTCEDAGVTSHFCACGSKTPISPTDPRALKAGQILVNGVNKLLEGTNGACVSYKDFFVKEANLVFPKEDIMLTIQTRPVRAVLRTTISITGSDVTLFNIERLDAYAPVSSCMNDEHAGYKDGELRRVVACVCKDDAWKVTEKN